MKLSALQRLRETTLQRLVREVLSDSAREWLAVGGTPLQILSLGEWNHAAGPDFLSVAIAAEGRVHVGNAEFHRAASDWQAHEHSTNPAFAGLLLHIVVQNDSAVEFARYTLIVPEVEIAAVLHSSLRQKDVLEQSNIPPPQQTSELLLSEKLHSEKLHSEKLHSEKLHSEKLHSEKLHSETSEIVHAWAVRRMIRKSEYAASMLNPYKPHEILLRLVAEFVDRQLTKKRRPRGMEQVQALQAFLHAHPANAFSEFLGNLTEQEPTSIRTALAHILKDRIHTEGAATRQEILLNVVLPLAIALCTHFHKKAHAAELWKYFTELPAKNAYSALLRRFPTVSQNLAYQQQGLLEYLAETYPPQRPNTVPIHTLRPEAAHTMAEYVITLYAASVQ
jgi:Protein of unknown function (DUF2851)